MSEKTIYMNEYMKTKRSTIKDKAVELLDKTKEDPLSVWINTHAPSSINSTQSGITIKLKVEEYERLNQWIKENMLGDKKPREIVVSIGNEVVFKKLID